MAKWCEMPGPFRRPTSDRHRGTGGLGQRVTLFARDEDGALIVFGLTLFVLMLMLGGISVDMMRYEQQRTQMQQTLDRSVLAAASLSQELPAKEVVEDYFTKAGLSEYLGSIVAPESLNARVVTASAQADVPTYFMHLLDIDNLQANAASSAEQGATNVEISLVLDVSGSMVIDANRIVALRSAARDFIDTVITPDTRDRVSISIVPYNGQVNLGPKLFNKFTTSDNHTYPESYCIDLPQSTFSDSSISRTTAYPQSPFSDTFFGHGLSNSDNSYTAPLTPRILTQGSGANAVSGYNGVWCVAKADNYVRPFLNDTTQLKKYITDLKPFAATAIDLGLKWGLELLSPDIQPVIAELSADPTIPVADRIPGIFANRPAPFKADQNLTDMTMKVIVLMTDGESSDQQSINEGYRTGLSPIYKSKTDGKYSIFHANKSGSYKYWVPHESDSSKRWKSAPYPKTSDAVQQTWEQVWKDVRMQWVAFQLYARANPTGSSQSLSNRFTSALADMRSYTSAAAKDTRMLAACDLAKSKDIIIYGIAMDSSTHGKNMVKACSTSPDSHFFPVTNLNVATAFRTIASNISQLRLTQ